MGKRKRSSLARNTRKAVQVRSMRSQQSDEERTQRLSQNRLHAGQSRANESDEDAIQRRSQNQQRIAQSRANETEEARTQRHSQDQQQSRASRANESDEATNVRLFQQQQRQQTLRDNRTAEENAATQAADRMRHARNEIARRVSTLNAARLRDVTLFNDNEIPFQLLSHSCGNFSSICRYCKAIRWELEGKNFCCHEGKIHLQNPPPPPDEMIALFDVNRNGQHFLNNIRSYNNSFTLASLGCKQITYPGFNPTFKIQGKIYHTIGSLLPPTGQEPKFMQRYFYDTDYQIQSIRNNSNLDLQQSLLFDIQQCLLNHNTYIRSLRFAAEIPKENLRLVLHADRANKPTNEHCRRYNLPMQSEVAVLSAGDKAANLDIVLNYTDGTLQRINECHRSYDPLHYVLLFPTGEDGWQPNLSRVDGTKLTALDFYAYRFHVRQDNFNIIMKGRRLMQQYAVDSWAKIESCRLKWVQTQETQKILRSEKYNALHDALSEDDVVNAGKRIILPSSIYGSPRFYAQAFQDAMAIVRHFGKPDYFITFTTNPKWPEISPALNQGENPHDRPDLLARVFKMKFHALMEDLIKNKVLGSVVAHTAVIEWQKRGLTHAHILLIMSEVDKPRTPEIINTVVSAELPDPHTNPTLFNLIKTHNLHGPCGNVNRNSPCMEGTGTERSCTKEFPKSFCEHTNIPQNSYPQYRRRRPTTGGHIATIRVKGQDFNADNSWVVPFNPLLTLKYRAHINVEVVHSVQAVKYLYKYITKGSDQAIMSINLENEKEMYELARYISASESFWKLYSFPLYQKYPPVEKLPLHLPNEQMVVYPVEDAAQVAAGGPPSTKLTAYFDTNARDQGARLILYPDFPKHFTWNQRDRKWVRRRRGRRGNQQPGIISDTIGRLPVVSLSPHQSELYYLRMLLHNKAGALSFDDLKTVNGVQCPTFQDCCIQIGILEDDDERDRLMEEAASIRFGDHLRELFATILLYNKPRDPLQFWESHKHAMSHDLMHRDNLSEPSDEILNEVLLYLQDRIQQDGYRDLHDDFQLPRPNVNVIPRANIPWIIREETMYDRTALQQKVDQTYPTLNPEQRIIFDSVIDSVETNSGKIFSLNACGGSGKTYTINLILRAVRARNYVALATATSGIAATLLDNGRTLHSRAKIPINIHEHSTCNISKRDSRAELFRMCTLLVIDEDTMGHRFVFEALNRTLKDVRENDALFGGITVLLSGDWRQILPVVPKGGRPQIVDACLKSSHIWKSVHHFTLSQNMRLTNSAESNEADFANMLLTLGKGDFAHFPDIGKYKINLPDHLLLNSFELSHLCDFVFNDLQMNHQNKNWLCSRAIICPTNDAVDHVNNIMLQRFPSTISRTYKSADTLLQGNEHQYPIEFINTLKPAGMPPHELTLKVGCCVMLLRNLDSRNGHVNGARYVVRQLHEHIIEGEVAVGEHAGKILFIPRIPICPSDNSYPFKMKRLQFPVRPAFAVTANKSQGQTLSKVGIYLDRPFFSHGQLYVALSRVTSSFNLRILARDSEFPGKLGQYTDNVVYPEVLAN